MTNLPNTPVNATAEAVAAVARLEVAEADRSGHFAEKSLAELRSSGLLGIFATAEGPTGAEYLREYSTVARILGRASLSVAVIWMMHSQQVLTIGRYGSAELRSEVFESVRRGTNYIGSVTTETESGGDLFTSAAEQHCHVDRIHIRRTAPIVTGGQHADSFLVKMRATDAATPRDTALVYAERADLTITPGRRWDMMGMRSTGNVALELAGSVPRTNELSAPLAEIAATLFAPLAHIGWASAWLGCAEEAWARVLRWAHRAGRRKLLDSDAVLEDIGRIREHLEIVSAYLHGCVQRIERGGVDITGTADQIHINVLKTIASTHCYAAVEQMVELVGLAEGYTRDSELELELALRDLRSAGLMFSDRRLRRSTGALGLLDRDTTLLQGDAPDGTPTRRPQRAGS